MGSTHQARSAAIVARIDFPQKVCVNAVQFSERCAPASTESIGSVNGCYGGRIPTSLDVSVDELWYFVAIAARELATLVCLRGHDDHVEVAKFEAAAHLVA